MWIECDGKNKYVNSNHLTSIARHEMSTDDWRVSAEDVAGTWHTIARDMDERESRRRMDALLLELEDETEDDWTGR